MAAGRAHRSNAGAKMAGLLDKEVDFLNLFSWKIVENIFQQEEDDFYKTTYGGFNDEGDDGDFNYNSPQEDDDVVDSDFSIDENDEVKSDPEDDESSRKKPKRGDGVQTKAYKVGTKSALLGLKFSTHSQVLKSDLNLTTSNGRSLQEKRWEKGEERRKWQSQNQNRLRDFKFKTSGGAKIFGNIQVVLIEHLNLKT